MGWDIPLLTEAVEAYELGEGEDFRAVTYCGWDASVPRIPVGAFRMRRFLLVA